MRYKQSVLVKNVSLTEAKKVFNDITFLKYLISFQPVKVIQWDGTFDGAFAHMRFWFFGWKDFMVMHSQNTSDEQSFSFKDIGSVLPFGLTKWEHAHRVIKDGRNIRIIDDIEFASNSSSLNYLIFPILIAPIFIRKILYKTYNWSNLSI